MWTFKWLPDPVHSWWEFDLYTGAAPGSPACGRVRNCVTLYLPPCTCFQKKKKNVGVDGCKLQGAGNKAKSTSVGGLSIKARSFPLVVQGSRTGIPSLSTSAWPIIPVRFHSSSSFVWLEFDAGDQVWVKIVNSHSSCRGIFRIKERR